MSKQWWIAGGLVIIIVTAGAVWYGLHELKQPSTPTSAPTATDVQSPNQAMPTQPTAKQQDVRLYFIRVDDSGSGPIGCGDFLEAVERTVTTTDPVRRSLEELVNVKSEYYADSGLRNALWQSDLTVEKVEVRNDTVYVELSGQLQLAGECDIPRVEAQLTATAENTAGVDSSQITINSQPLSEALSLR